MTNPVTTFVGGINPFLKLIISSERRIFDFLESNGPVTIAALKEEFQSTEYSIYKTLRSLIAIKAVSRFKKLKPNSHHRYFCYEISTRRQYAADARKRLH